MVGMYPFCHVLSDVNVTQLMKMRDDMAYDRLHTVCFPELDKIYKRHDATAENIEGILKALVDEGFGAASFQDQRMQVQTARVLLLCGMVPHVYQKHYTDWRADGFLRRFLWLHYKLADSNVIFNAIHEWRSLEFFSDPIIFAVASKEIPYAVSDSESQELATMLKDQSSAETPFILLKKILSALKWRYPNDRKKPMEILRDVAPAFSKGGAEMEIASIVRMQPQPIRPRRKKASGSR